MSRPVKVTAVLSSPLGADPPTLDGLCELAMVWKRQSIMETAADDRHDWEWVPPGQDVPRENLGKIPIPIERQWVGDWPVACASSPILGTVHDDRHGHYHKQYPVGSADLLTPKERTKIAPSGGRFKSFRLPLRLRLVDRVVWFARLKHGGRSPMGVLRGLLNRHVRAIGKKTAYGYGTVAEWVVEPVDEDCSWFAPSPDGPVLMRPLPLGAELPDGLLGARRDFGAVVCPSWQQSLWCERWSPC